MIGAVCCEGVLFFERLLKGRNWGQQGNQWERVGPEGQSEGDDRASRAIKGRVRGQKGDQGERVGQKGGLGEILGPRPAGHPSKHTWV